MDEPGDNCDLLSETQKQLLTDSVFNCVELLKRLNFINELHSEKYSTGEALTFGNYLAKSIIKMSKEMCFIEEEMLFLDEENIEENIESFDAGELALTIDVQESEQLTASKIK